MDKIKDRQKLAWEGMFYSIQRIDLLIVSICSAGIYVILETVKFLVDKNDDVSILLKISGTLFISGIIINFLSQIFGYKSNQQDYLMCQTELDCEELKSEENIAKIEKYDKCSNLFNNLTNKFNYISMTSMILGLIFLLIYFLITF